MKMFLFCCGCKFQGDTFLDANYSVAFLVVCRVPFAKLVGPILNEVIDNLHCSYKLHGYHIKTVSLLLL